MSTNPTFYPSKEEAKHICDKNQYGEASIIEIIKLQIRLLFCKATRAYSRRNTKLTKKIKKAKLHTLPNSVKEDIQKEIQKKLSE